MKTEVKHTPGPWLQTAPLSLVIKLEGGKQIALARALSSDDWEACANARLIAAAPDLLAALKTCQDEFVTLAARLTNPYRANALSCIELAKAAIAKSEGSK